MGLVGGMVRGGENQLGGRVAIGERSLEGRRYGKGGGDAGDDLEGDSFGAQGFHLFVGAAEDEGVAGLEAQDGTVLVGVFDHEGVNAGLGDAWLSAAFADGDDEGCGAGEVEHFVRDEVVGQNDVGGLDEVKGTAGEEIRVARACTAEVNFAGFDGVAHDLGLVRAWARA